MVYSLRLYHKKMEKCLCLHSYYRIDVEGVGGERGRKRLYLIASSFTGMLLCSNVGSIRKCVCEKCVRSVR
jgi:hypothetical protein